MQSGRSMGRMLAGAAMAALLIAPAMAQQLPRPDRGGVPENKLYDYGGMGPPATPAIIADARKSAKVPAAPGPFKPDWQSIEANYKTPAWFPGHKFGIFIHWGVYAVAAHRNEWYEKHMYGADRDWHATNFGPQEKVGYKDLIPMFTADKWNPDDWATLFKASGARFIMPAAQHHDNFALWDSKVTRYNSVAMGPKRDLIGDLAKAVRAQGMRFGLSNHGVENFTFINPPGDLNERLKAAKADLYDPAWADFYNVADRSPAAMSRFLADWVDRNIELIDKYQPDILWFDNGANLRILDPLKLEIAAYYYNRARQWKKDVSISTKFVAYAPSNDDTKQIGSILDFEKVGSRSPADIRMQPWIVDDAIGSTWGYTKSMTVAGPGTIINRLVDTVSKNGTYLLNISPMADGTIPDAQRTTLLAVGQWLNTNGEAIYDSTPWTQFGDPVNKSVRFTRRSNTLYAILLGRQSGSVTIPSLTPAKGKVGRVSMLGGGMVKASQGAGGLTIDVPATLPAGGENGIVLKIDGMGSVRS